MNQTFTTFRCPICNQLLEFPWTITTGAINRRTNTIEAKVDIDRAAARAAFEEHCLADPDTHQHAFQGDTASPDTSQEYFLDLLRRIDGLAP